MALDGCNAVVTGGASGLGRALCLELARRGGTVLIADIDADGASETAELVRAAGGSAAIAECDVRQWEQVEALAHRAAAEIGPIDVLCNNAGVAAVGPFEEISLEDWRWCVDINLWGVIYGCRAFLPKMRERRRGYVLNVASAAGLLAPPGMAPYNITKSAVVALSETLHAEYAPHVHVTALCPTFFRTAIMDNARGADEKSSRATKKLMDRSALQAPDVARIALDAVQRGTLYAVPMRDGRMFWRLKRALPQRYYDVLARIFAQQSKR
ncbi:MAG: short-chain dehydrogenase [Sandaracinus sp.]|nr:short-chain dehydrogenase [Sandaracinus sp.]|tara:strand:- start:1101 stop:1907 length:807 start_codon:yes stop_codon:yes gene_type:complete